MTKEVETIRLLVPRATANHLRYQLTRRGFIRLGSAAVGGWFLAACGGGDSAPRPATTDDGGSDRRPPGRSVATSPSTPGPSIRTRRTPRPSPPPTA